MARPRVHDDALRTRLLEAASEAVSVHGADRLALRDVATRAGTSTTAVYSLFGGRAELLAAVGDEAFRRFAAHLDDTPRGSGPREHLLELGLAYRRSALDDPHFYRVMFDTRGVGARDGTGAPPHSSPTFGRLRDAVRSVVGPAATDRAVDDAAHTLWALVHGLVSLELAGLDAEAEPAHREARYVTALRGAGAAIVRGALDG